MQFVTRDGLHIEVGRVRRELLDNLNIPEPVPPLRDVETWGGVVEKVPVLDDLHYLRSLRLWRTRLWKDSFSIIAQALTYTVPEGIDLDGLREIGLGIGAPADYLRYGTCAIEQNQLIELVYYHSTVTQRGISEAEARFGYTWRDQPLSAWSVGYSHGKRGDIAVDFRAALRSGMAWAQFCELTGQKQSEYVAFWNLEDRLVWLLNNEH